ncbi:MAG: C39 family peptidase [Candidatus Bathyarchaeia archaeon]
MLTSSSMWIPCVPYGLFNEAKAIIIGEHHFIDVPFYYQVKTYYCGPAALQIVFDYFGENVSQFEIADVARTIPYVTYTDELRRAAHFSDMSTSMGSEMPENITGYSARKHGYAAFEMFSMTLDDLKALIDRDFPVILLMRWIPGEPYGHYRVAVGYNATHVFLHDPWNNVLWGGDYGGPNLPMNYTFFNEMWDYSGHWGLFVSPWNVNIEMPNNVYVGQTFTVTATVFYVCPPQTPIYNYEASSCNATITLPEGIVLADGESQSKSLGEIYAGGRAQTSWRVKAKRPGNYSIFVEAEGKITGFVVEKAGVGPSYQ